METSDWVEKPTPDWFEKIIKEEKLTEIRLPYKKQKPKHHPNMGTYFRNTLLTHTRLEHWRAYNSPNPDSLSPIPSTDTTPTSNTNNSNTNNNNTNNVNITTLVTNTNPAPAAYADSTSEFVPTSQDSYRQTTVTLAYIGQNLNGHPQYIHGGVTAALLDEATSTAVWTKLKGGSGILTATMKIDYRAPLPTPSWVVLRTWVEKNERRKWIVNGVVEDGKGKEKTIFAEVQAIFIEINKSKL